MSTTHQKALNLPITMEDSLFEDNTRSLDTGIEGTKPLSGRVKEEDSANHSGIFLPMSPHTHGDYENLRLLLIEERRMNKGLVEQNSSLLEDLRRIRRELNNLRSRVHFVGRKLQEEAARRSHGSNSSGSEEELEEDKSESDSG
ncbi:hypothetical protein MVEN_00171700 [Mycena venus]|uniref:Uncharacterized protein n=1 Tax=Mycena venus TaxID=2733690 RepID=A0A8H7DBM2_9AGAR|nr:hypothetical protein MVEN_00171700 [Mycena venus]